MCADGLAPVVQRYDLCRVRGVGDRGLQLGGWRDLRGKLAGDHDDRGKRTRRYRLEDVVDGDVGSGRSVWGEGVDRVEQLGVERRVVLCQSIRQPAGIGLFFGARHFGQRAVEQLGHRFVQQSVAYGRCKLRTQSEHGLARIGIDLVPLCSRTTVECVREKRSLTKLGGRGLGHEQ